jgi:hypothetical protein
MRACGRQRSEIRYTKLRSGVSHAKLRHECTRTVTSSGVELHCAQASTLYRGHFYLPMHSSALDVHRCHSLYVPPHHPKQHSPATTHNDNQRRAICSSSGKQSRRSTPSTRGRQGTAATIRRTRRHLLYPLVVQPLQNEGGRDLLSTVGSKARQPKRQHPIQIQHSCSAKPLDNEGLGGLRVHEKLMGAAEHTHHTRHNHEPGHDNWRTVHVIHSTCTTLFPSFSNYWKAVPAGHVRYTPPT